MKKIFLFLSFLIIPFEIINIVLNFSTVVAFQQGGFGWNTYCVLYSLDIFKGVCVVILCVCLIAWAFCKTNLTNSIRYIYEQYKEMRQKKKAEKQKAKKEKLQKQLNELEKD